MNAIARVSRGVFSLGLLAVVWAGCTPPTSFEGESKFPGGAEACFHKCQEQRMEMASFVYVGEFATACACRLQTAPVPLPAAPAGAAAPHAAADTDESGAVVAASTGVEMQRRRIEAQRRDSAMQPMIMH